MFPSTFVRALSMLLTCGYKCMITISQPQAPSRAILALPSSRLRAEDRGRCHVDTTFFFFYHGAVVIESSVSLGQDRGKWLCALNREFWV